MYEVKLEEERKKEPEGATRKGKQNARTSVRRKCELKEREGGLL
jgi:hypothetical protein